MGRRDRGKREIGERGRGGGGFRVREGGMERREGGKEGRGRWEELSQRPTWQ